MRENMKSPPPDTAELRVVLDTTSTTIAVGGVVGGVVGGFAHLHLLRTAATSSASTSGFFTDDCNQSGQPERRQAKPRHIRPTCLSRTCECCPSSRHCCACRSRFRLKAGCRTSAF